METQDLKNKKNGIMIWASIGWALVLVLAFLYGSKFRSENIVGSNVKKADILAKMRINLLKAVELEKNAVMAISDKDSETFADQSFKAAEAVENDLHKLDSLTDGTDSLLAELRDCWKNFREIDKKLLELSVQNTNLKAAGLSYTKGAEIAGRFEHSIIKLTELYPEDVKIAKLGSQAAISVFKIYGFQAPHINESGDEQMDKIEAIMKNEADIAKTSLKTLSYITDIGGRASFDEAEALFTEFMKINAEVVRLSRLNSNVKSLELSLGRKRKVAAQCDEILSMMQENISKKAFKSPR